MEFSRSIFVHCAVLVRPRHVVALIYLGNRGNSLSEAGLQSRQKGPAVWAFAILNADITCIRTHRYAVWCFLTGSVWGSCTCLVLPSCSLRGSCHSLFSWSRPERWPTLSLEPRNTVITVLICLTWTIINECATFFFFSGVNNFNQLFCSSQESD